MNHAKLKKYREKRSQHLRLISPLMPCIRILCVIIVAHDTLYQYTYPQFQLVSTAMINAFPLQLFFLVLTLLQPIWSHADENAPLNNTRPLRICIDDLKPWKIVNAESISGADIDLLQAFAKRLDIKLEFMHAPFKRCLYNMANGTSDIVTGLLYREKRTDYIHYFFPPYKKKSNKAFYVLKGDGVKIDSYNDLKLLRIGVERGVEYFPKFDNDTSLLKEPTTYSEQNVQKLLSHRIDTFIITDSEGDYLLNLMGYNDLIVKTNWGYYRNNPVYIGLTKHSDFSPFRNKFENAYSEMYKSGEIHLILDQYFIRNNLPIPDYK